MQGSQMQLDMHDANEPNVLDPQHLPDTEVLAEGFRGCLQVRPTTLTHKPDHARLNGSGKSEPNCSCNCPSVLLAAAV